MAPLLDRRAARAIALAGAACLGRLVMADGRFRYHYDPARPGAYAGTYNTVRHCGAAWALLETQRLFGPVPSAAPAGLAAVRHAFDHFVAPFGEGLVLVDAGKAKLGGNALAILALAEAHRADPDPRFLAAAAGLARHLLAEAREDGDFHHTRLLATGERTDFRSRYYTGEAFFALLALSEAGGDPASADFAFAAMRRLAVKADGAPGGHWMAYALGRAVAAGHEDLRPYADRVARTFVAWPEAEWASNSTWIACSAEALVQWLRMEEEAPRPDGPSPLAGPARKLLRRWLRMLQGFRTADGAFVCGPGRTDVRIDYIQHAVSAFAGYSRLKGPG